MRNISRRNFLKLSSLVSISALTGFTSITCSKKKDSKESDKLYIYNWPFYISNKLIKDFENEFSIKIIYDNYSSNEELLAKLQAGATGYDLIFPSDYMVKTMASNNLLEKIDLTKIPNFKNLDSQFIKLPFDPENNYSVPYLWGTAGIAYNSEKIPDKIESWKVLWDERFKDRISMLDDIRELLGACFKMLGYSVNTKEPERIEEAKKLLFKQKPLVKAYTSDTYVDFLKSEDIWLCQGYSGDVFQVIKEKKSIKYVIPIEGTSIWVDNMCIPKGARNKENAHKFINFVLRPEVSAEISNFTWYSNPNPNSHKFTNPDIINNPSIYPPKHILDKCEFFQDVGETIKIYEQIFNDLKSV